MSDAPPNPDVTGRDAAMIVMGMLYGISRIQTLPPDRQEASDLDDMIALVKEMVLDANRRRILARRVAGHTGHLPDLGDGEGDPRSEVAVGFGEVTGPAVLAWMQSNSEPKDGRLVAIVPAAIPGSVPEEIQRIMELMRNSGFAAMAIEE